MENQAALYGRNAGEQAANWLAQAERHIDERFGQGYAKANPALMAAMVQASAMDYHASWLGQAIEFHGTQLVASS